MPFAIGGSTSRHLASAFRARLLRRFDKRLVLYRWQEKSHTCRSVPGLQIHRFAGIEEVPAGILDDKSKGAMPRHWFQGRFAEGAELWAGVKDGIAMCYVWVVKASLLSGWYVALNSDDLLIYSVVTRSQSRGLGIAPLVFFEIVGEYSHCGNDLLADCRHWNRPARRAFEKVGFREFAIIEPSAMVPIDKPR